MQRDLIPELSEPVEKSQYERDLELLQRCEDQAVQQGGSPADFFIAMGDIARERSEGRGE